MADALAASQDRTFTRATRTTARRNPPQRRPAAGQLARCLDGHLFGLVATARPDRRRQICYASEDAV